MDNFPTGIDQETLDSGIEWDDDRIEKTDPEDGLEPSDIQKMLDPINN